MLRKLLAILAADMSLAAGTVLVAAYTLYLLTGSSAIGNLHVARLSCEDATIAAIQADFGGRSQAERRRLEKEADQACVRLQEAARPL